MVNGSWPASMPRDLDDNFPANCAIFLPVNSTKVASTWSTLTRQTGYLHSFSGHSRRSILHLP